MPTNTTDGQSADLGDREPPRGFTPVPNVILDSGLSMAARMCYIALASFAWGDKAQCFPGNESLAARMGCHSRTVIRAKQELVEAGLLEVTRRGLNRTNLYTLVLKQGGSDESSGQERSSSRANKTSDKKRRISDGDPTDLSSDSVPNLENDSNLPVRKLAEDEQYLADCALRLGVDNAEALVRSYSERFPKTLGRASWEFQHAYDCDVVRDPAAYVAALLRNGPRARDTAWDLGNHRRRTIAQTKLSRERARERGLRPPGSPQPRGAPRWWNSPEEAS